MTGSTDHPRVAVFGGAGFLGSFVADALTEQGLDVIIFDRVPSPYLRKGQTGVVGDILDTAAVEAAVEGCDVIYNYAGIADIGEASEAPLETVRVNILGNTVLLEAARKLGVKRFMFASTLYVYSSSGGFYRSTKQACELIIEDYQRLFGLPYTILRYGSLYGPRSGEANWIWCMLRDALVSGKVIRVGDGDEIREFIHVWDAASSSVHVLSSEFSNAHVIISGQQSVRVRDLLNTVQDMLGGRLEVEYSPTPEAEASAAASLHYKVSPYSFTPRIARKIVRPSYVDLGQGLLDLMGHVHRAEGGFTEAGDVLVGDAGKQSGHRG